MCRVKVTIHSCSKVTLQDRHLKRTQDQPRWAFSSFQMHCRCDAGDYILFTPMNGCILFGYVCVLVSAALKLPPRPHCVEHNKNGTTNFNLTTGKLDAQFAAMTL